LIVWPWAQSAPVWLVYVGAWAVTLALAYVVWRFVERPARRYLVALAGGSATQRTTPRPETFRAVT
jgi:peptidoglycan/LPS O-acetylase OafA/YrhL